MAPSAAATQAVQASPDVHALLDRLHTESEAQESSTSQLLWYARRLVSHYLFNSTWSAASDKQQLDKFVSLERDKSRLAYLLARSIGARGIVEAGTSFGVSTIYLALAVGQNVKAAGGGPGKVIATEKEPSKADRARRHWKEAGEEVEPWIELRVGDLLETLKVDEGMPEQVDMLLLDSKSCEEMRKWCVVLTVEPVWTPLALPTLKIIQPRLRRGALVLVDNTSWAKSMYKELLDYIHDPNNGFKTTTAPYRGGFEIAAYLPDNARL